MEQQTTRYRRMPKGERRVRFADTVGLELVSIFLIDFINSYYFSIRTHKFSLPHKPHNSSNNNNNNNNTSNSRSSSVNDSKDSPNSNTTTNGINTFSPKSSDNNHYRSSTGYQSNNNYSYSYNYNYNYNYNTSTNNSIINSSGYNSKSDQPSSAGAVKQRIDPDPHRQSYVCEFTQPISLVSYKERVKINKVNLETCRVATGAGNVSVSCTIRVLNLSYNKSVIVRYTTDEWHSYTDCLASYVPGSCDGWSDKFTSTFSVSNQVKSFQTGQRIIFAIKYTFDGDNVCWDNNGGLNYTVKKI